MAEKRIMQTDRPDFPPELIDRFIDCLLMMGAGFDRPAAWGIVNRAGETLLDRALFLEAAAREVGKRWTADSCDFIETSIVAARLQLFVHMLEMEIPFVPELRSNPTVLIACHGAEHHTLVNQLLGLLYKSLGWQKRILTAEPPLIAKELASHSRLDAVCINWTSEVHMDDVRELVGRIVALPEGLRPIIIAGGIAAEKHVNELLRWGVDCICDSVYAAVNISEKYILLRNSSHELAEARQLLNCSIHFGAPVYE